MLSLKSFRSKAKGLPDLLNWAAVIADGVVLNKDGSLTAGFYYKGQDLATVTTNERNRISSIVNASLNQLGGEWVINQDAIRIEASGYSPRASSHFPDPITQLIDDERRESFDLEGSHYESAYALVLTYLPMRLTESRIADLMYIDESEADKESASTKSLRIFESTLQEVEDRLSSILDLTRMVGIKYTDEEGVEHTHDMLLQYLHYTLTGNPHPINLPPCPMYLDAVIGGHDFFGGVVPKIDDQYITIVAIDGFPQESYPGILSALDQLPVRYRWSTRFVFMDSIVAEKHLKAFRRKWEQKVRGFWDQVFHAQQTSKTTINSDASSMMGEADEALSEASSGIVTYGYYTSVVVLMDSNRNLIEESAREIKRVINNIGFNARVESINAMEAWLGSLPAHAAPNLRRPMMHTLNLADMLPLSSIWAGQEFSPCPFYPKKSPALMYANTDGCTPFRLNLHVGDLGHTLMLGPTGSGKSTALALIAAQFRRYENATVFVFDKGSSMEPLTKAIGGSHFNIAGDDAESELFFAPLENLDQPGELGWASDWINTILELTGIHVTPSHRNTVHDALISLRDSGSDRTFTNFQVSIQNKELKSALEPYTSAGAMGQLLDAEQDGLTLGNWSCFEIEQLMNRKDMTRLPVLLYLFHRIEKRMKGQPCLLILDEAWLMLGNQVFRDKIREWLKVLRKANCAVLLATQSLSDAANSGILDVLAESCPTKIFLSNAEASSEENIPLYRLLGCNESEIRTITDMIPKRQYFVKGEGRRKVELAIGNIALSFVGASSKEDIAAIRLLEKEYGEHWPWIWLEKRRVDYAKYKNPSDIDFNFNRNEEYV